MTLRGLRLAPRFPAIAAVTLCAFTGCASSTVLQSQPPGAQVKINGAYVGKTPYTYTDTKIVGTTTPIRLEAPGYKPMDVMIQRNEEVDPLALIGGICLLIPFFWVMRYHPTHLYQLVPEGAEPPAAAPGAPVPPPAYPPPEAAPGPAGYPPPPPGYPPPAPTN